MEHPESVAALLRRHREGRGWSLDYLARRSGLSSKGLRKIEAGESCPRIGTINILASEFGWDPHERARFLAASKRCKSDRLVPSLEATAEPARLPTPHTRLIGREADVLQVECELARGRLVTLTGPGGVGKSRLALAVATAARPKLVDSLCYVNLESLGSAADLTSAIAHALGARTTAGSPILDSIEGFLKNRSFLLVLDGFERLLDDATQGAPQEVGRQRLPSSAALVAELVARCPHLRILVTSRSALRVGAETAFPVLPLMLPEGDDLARPDALAQCPSVALFLDRAHAANPARRIAGEELRAVAEICTRLDGLPLAIELAAAKVRLLSPTMLLQRLRPRLPLLTNGQRDMPARHQTLRDAIRWSYDLLDAGEQRLFRTLSVFAGSFDLEAAEGVVDGRVGAGPETFSRIESLHAKSLLRTDVSAQGEARYSMLETIHEFAAEQLPEEETFVARSRHLSYFGNLAAEVEAKLRGSNSELQLDERELDRLAADYHNLRAALAWCQHPDRQLAEVEEGLSLATALHAFWILRDRIDEGRAYLSGLLHSPVGAAARPILRAKALHVRGALASAQGDFDKAEPDLREALERFRVKEDVPWTALTLRALGGVKLYQGRFDEAARHYDDYLAFATSLDDRRGIARARHFLGRVALAQEDPEGALRNFDESRRIFQGPPEDRWGVAGALTDLGYLALCAASHTGAQAARAHFEGSLKRREPHDTRGNAWANHGLALALQAMGDCARARHLLVTSLKGFVALGDRVGIAECLLGLATVALAEGASERAARLWDGASVLCKDMGVRIVQGPFRSRRSYDTLIIWASAETEAVQRSLEHLGPAERSPQQVVEYAMSCR